MKDFISSKMRFFAFAALFIWIKSYVIYLVEFNLDIQNILQHFLLLINPISSTLIFLSIALFARGKRVGAYILTVHIFMSFLLYANVVYYRFNTDFITLPVLTQTSNFASLGGSISSLVTWTDLFYLMDINILNYLIFKHKEIRTEEKRNFKRPLILMGIGALVFTIKLGLAEIDRPELLKRTFDRNYIVKYLGAYNFTIFDAVQNVKSSTQRVLADSSDVTEVQNYTNNKYAESDEDLFGIAEGKNVIKIHLVSFQSLMIAHELDREEVTPFLTSLLNDEPENFTYFENFIQQTEQ